MANVAVIGAGAWGTALAVHAARVGHDVTMWAFEPDVVADVNERHRNSAFLADAALPDNLRATSSLAEAVGDAAFVLLVPPSEHLRSVGAALAPSLPSDAVVICATKGIEQSSLKLMSGVLEEVLPEVGPERMTFLSGPSFAKEVARGLPTDVALASRSRETAELVQAQLHAPMFRIYTSRDPVGVQVGGAIKNVAAVATGASDGLGLGHNARAGLITRALAEMTRLGVALGADPLTFLGLAGVGDLVLTCTGELSRNRTLGKTVAEGADAKQFLASQRTVAEGFNTCAAAWALARQRGVDMPITEQVYMVLHEGRPLSEAVQFLLERDKKDELDGIRRRSDFPGPR